MKKCRKKYIHRDQKRDCNGISFVNSTHKRDELNGISIVVLISFTCPKVAKC